MEFNEPPKALEPSLAMVVAAAIIGGLTGVSAYWWLEHGRDYVVSVRPPIAVVDFARIAAQAPDSSRTADVLDAQLVRIKRDIQKLKDAGFLVLDGQSVLGAPESLYVPMDH